MLKWRPFRSTLTFARKLVLALASVLVFNSPQDDFEEYFMPNTNCFWEVSEHVLSRIEISMRLRTCSDTSQKHLQGRLVSHETPAALAGRSALVDYWSENPWVAKKTGVNL